MAISPCSAQTREPGDSKSQPAGEVAASAATPRIETGRVKLAVGNDEFEPGAELQSGDGWLALVCAQMDCALEPATLRVQPEQGVYNEQDTAGQHLRFLTDEPLKSGLVVTWFQRDPALPWLKAGPVRTYGAAPPLGNGALEMQVNVPGAESIRLVPLFQPPGKAQEATGGGGDYVLQLRTSEKRQLLPGQLGSCSGTVDNSYLLWAGDLDGDGRPDLLISFGDYGSADLYLSSAARSSEIAGLAGSFLLPPVETECDTTGWLEPLSAEAASANAAGRETLAFGSLQGDVIYDVMYYRDGSWVEPYQSSDNDEIDRTFGPATDRNRDIQHYASLYWGTENATAFSRWFRVNAQNPVTIKFRSAFVGGSAGDCEADSVVLKTDDGGASHNPAGYGWVATQKEGFDWDDFPTIAYVYLDPKEAVTNARSKLVKPVPSDMEGLVHAIMTKWAPLEGAVVKQMKIPASSLDSIRQQLSAATFFDFGISRAVLRRQDQALVFFHAKKFFQNPLLRDRNGDDSVAIDYVGWALLDADMQVISWPRSSVNLEASPNVDVDSYLEVSPVAVVEIQGRQFLIENANEYEADNEQPGLRVLELVGGDLVKRATYTSTCE